MSFYSYSLKNKKLYVLKKLVAIGFDTTFNAWYAIKQYLSQAIPQIDSPEVYEVGVLVDVVVVCVVGVLKKN